MRRFEIRTMTRPDLDWAVTMAAREGWNPGLHDADAFFAQDPEGFLIGLLDGQPIGSVSCVSYEGQFGFIGFYIVAREHRGRRYGVDLGRRAIERLSGHTIGLDGVFEKQANYERAGFQTAYSNVRFEYENSRPPVGDLGVEMMAARGVPFSELAAYDRGMFPAARERFLRAWLAMPDAHRMVARDGDGIRGWGCIRKCRLGHKVGPLFADTPDYADALFRTLCDLVGEDEKIYLDVPDINGAGMELAERYGMKRVFGTARMYLGGAPDVDMTRVYGVTSFELG